MTGLESAQPNIEPEFKAKSAQESHKDLMAEPQIEFGSPEYLEMVSGGIDAHLDKIGKSYPDTGQAIAEFKEATDNVNVDDANYAAALEKLITSLSDYDARLPEKVLYAAIGDLQKDLITLRML
jgi:hypothetical protein